MILSLCFVFSLSACGKNNSNIQQEPEEFFEERPAESMEQHEDPVYVYREDTIQDDPNLVFMGLVNADEEDVKASSQAESADKSDGKTAINNSLPSGGSDAATDTSGTITSSDENRGTATDGDTENTSGSNTDSTDQVAKYQDVSGLNNAIAIPAIYGWAGEMVTATVQLCGQVELCAADMAVQYDKRYLKWVGTAAEDDDIIVHCDEETGTVYINLLRMRNAQEVLPLCQLQFTVLTTEPITTVLDAQVKEAVSLGAESAIDFCPYSVIDGTVYLNQTGG